jgi:DNA-binding CsgD family transcriptional regulator
MRKRDTILVDSMPESDPAYPIVSAILKVVPASRWAFARLETDGELAHLLSSDPQGSLADLKAEHKSQRRTTKAGGRIAATLGPLGDYASGITLLFADGRANFGILQMLRMNDLGPFTSSEIAMLTLALDGTSEQLSALRLNAHARARSRADYDDLAVPSELKDEGETYVLDSDLQIVLTWSGEHRRRAAITGLRMHLAQRLPAVLEDSVRQLIAGWQQDPATQLPGISRPVPFLVVRTQPVSGASGLLIGVHVDRFRPRQSLTLPAARFRISPRELEVLALLLDGAKLQRIAETLNITVSTVQDHVKSMVDKTESRNRTGLAARVLGWEKVSEGV